MPWINQIDPKREPDLHRMVQDAETTWKDVLGSSPDQVEAVWRTEVEQGPAGPRPLLLLRLTDRVTGRSIPEERFAPWDFGDDERLFDRLHRIWGKLLQASTHAHLERLNELIGQIPED